MKKHPVLFFFIIIFSIFFFIMAIIITMALSFKGSHAFRHESVAIVKIQGPIFESMDILKELNELEADTDIKAVVVRLNSPGGAVAPSQEISRQILKLKKTKKVIVSMGTVAASGGYYIASAADKIVASPGTITGSIGVIIESLGLYELAQKLYIEPRVIKSGQYKDVGSPFKELSREDRAYLQNISDDMYQQFLTAISQTRNIPLDKLRPLAQGKVYTGLQAQNLGLVDQLGNLYDATALAKAEAGLPAHAGVRWPKEPTMFQRLFEAQDAQGLIRFFLTGYLPLWYFQANKLPNYQLQ